MTALPWNRMSLCFVAASAAVVLMGCGTYVYRSYQGPPPGVIVETSPIYTPEYYYDPGIQAYYYYYPNAGWRYYPGLPPVGVTYWSGAPPVYLPPPPRGYFIVRPPPFETARFRFYFDPRRHLYYYRDPDHPVWRYYPGRPPLHAHFWAGPRPGILPGPPHGVPGYRPPAGWRRDNNQK